MAIWTQLSDPQVWETYYTYKTEKRHLTRSEEKDLRKYIDEKEYLSVLQKLFDGDSLSVPEKKLIRKMHTDKKRVVYLYPREENYLLKLITFLLLRRFDSIFSDSLYSFRVETGVNKAMKRILRIPKLQHKYTYKVDISDYFNSISVPLMLNKLQVVLRDEPEIYKLFEDCLNNSTVLDDGKFVEEKKGVMAGTPFAVFLANVYLMDLDASFDTNEVTYARYSDDIMIFADTKEQQEDARTQILSSLKEHGLTVNAKKEISTNPGENWSFLGIQYAAGVVDISPISKDKLKAKMRRRARAIKRWQIRKGATNEQAVKAFIRAMNRKFFDADSSHELTWSRWYFPVINTPDTLHELDLYMQQWIRFLSCGRHNKASFNFRYEDMKALGYISLVHAWYEERKVEKGK